MLTVFLVNVFQAPTHIEYRIPITEYRFSYSSRIDFQRFRQRLDCILKIFNL